MTFRRKDNHVNYPNISKSNFNKVKGTFSNELSH
ncbi:hypothetical protein [Staphylococcus phage PT94]